MMHSVKNTGKESEGKLMDDVNDTFDSDLDYTINF